MKKKLIITMVIVSLLFVTTYLQATSGDSIGILNNNIVKSNVDGGSYSYDNEEPSLNAYLVAGGVLIVCYIIYIIAKPDGFIGHEPSVKSNDLYSDKDTDLQLSN